MRRSNYATESVLLVLESTGGAAVCLTSAQEDAIFEFSAVEGPLPLAGRILILYHLIVRLALVQGEVVVVEKVAIALAVAVRHTSIILIVQNLLAIIQLRLTIHILVHEPRSTQEAILKVYLSHP